MGEGVGLEALPGLELVPKFPGTKNIQREG